MPRYQKNSQSMWQTEKSPIPTSSANETFISKKNPSSHNPQYKTAHLDSLHTQNLPQVPFPTSYSFSSLSCCSVEATSIVGTLAHECNVTPVMNASYSKTVESRVLAANQPKCRDQMLSEQTGIPGGSYLYNPKSNQPFGNFTGGPAPTKLTHKIGVMEMMWLLWQGCWGQNQELEVNRIVMNK